MKRALLSLSVALALSAAVPTLAVAQKGGGHGGGGISPGGGGGVAAGGGGVARGGGGVAVGGGGGAGFARSAPSAGFVARGAPSAGAYAATPRSGPRVVEGGVSPGGQRFVQGGRGNWQGGHRRHGRHFLVGPGVGFYAYDGPYYEDYAYAADDCVQLRLIRGAWRRVNVCDSNDY
jgi:hypothetical protein